MCTFVHSVYSVYDCFTAFVCLLFICLHNNIFMWANCNNYLCFFFMQSCADPTTRPSCLSEKQLEGAIKHVVKRFPNIDTKVSLCMIIPSAKFDCGPNMKKERSDLLN